MREAIWGLKKIESLTLGLDTILFSQVFYAIFWIFFDAYIQE